MKLIYVLLFSFFSIANLSAQVNNKEKSQEELSILRGYIRNWSCVPYVNGSLFQDNLELNVEGNILILKQNYSTNEINVGFPEYTKTIINLSLISRFDVEENDKECAGITIRTKPNGIKLIQKLKNMDNEQPVKNEVQLREKFGWIDEGIRLRKTSEFSSRTRRVIQSLQLIVDLNR